MTKFIPLRIRTQYFDAIVRGEKNIEYRKYSPRLQKMLATTDQRVAVFVCGKRVHRRLIEKVEQMLTPSDFSAQGKQDVPTETCFAIYLGPIFKKA